MSTTTFHPLVECSFYLVEQGYCHPVLLKHVNPTLTIPQYVAWRRCATKDPQDAPFLWVVSTLVEMLDSFNASLHRIDFNQWWLEDAVFTSRFYDYIECYLTQAGQLWDAQVRLNNPYFMDIQQVWRYLNTTKRMALAA